MALTDFQEKLRGWMTNPDGEDLCPSCWELYLSQFTAELARMVKEDSTATSLLAETRRARDAWFTMCEKCGKGVHSPYATWEVEAPKKS